MKLCHLDMDGAEGLNQVDVDFLREIFVPKESRETQVETLQWQHQKPGRQQMHPAKFAADCSAGMNGLGNNNMNNKRSSAKITVMHASRLSSTGTASSNDPTFGRSATPLICNVRGSRKRERISSPIDPAGLSFDGMYEDEDACGPTDLKATKPTKQAYVQGRDDQEEITALHQTDYRYRGQYISPSGNDAPSLSEEDFPPCTKRANFSCMNPHPVAAAGQMKDHTSHPYANQGSCSSPYANQGSCSSLFGPPNQLSFQYTKPLHVPGNQGPYSALLAGRNNDVMPFHGNVPTKSPPTANTNQGPYSSLVRESGDANVTTVARPIPNGHRTSQGPYSQLVKSSHYTPKVQLPSWIGPNDVLQGDSEMGLSVFSNYAGNKLYREKVKSLLGYYRRATNSEERKIVATWVFSMVTEAGGRFLKTDSGGEWGQLSSSQAIKKIMNYYQLVLSKYRSNGGGHR